MDVERQVVGVEEVDRAFGAVGVRIDWHTSNHQGAERSLGAVVVAVKAGTWGDDILLLTNKVLSQQRPSTKAANTKARHFSAVLHSTRDVLQDVLTSGVNRTSSVLLRLPPSVGRTVDVAVGCQSCTVIHSTRQSDELLGVGGVVVQGSCHCVHHHVGSIVHTSFNQRDDCCVLLNCAFHTEERHGRNHQFQVKLSVVSTLLD